MALTRKMLKAMGIEDEDKITQIIEEHQSVVEEIATERDKFKSQAEELADVKKELVKANEKLSDMEDVKDKLSKLRDEYDTYKADVEAKSTHESKVKLYKALLTKAGISEKRHEAIIKVTDLDSIKLTKDGKFEDEDKIAKSIDEEWSEFKTTTQTKGADTSTPPASTGGNTFEKMSLAEKMAYANEHPDSAEVKEYLK
jgi:uncharacterized Zn finger protein